MQQMMLFTIDDYEIQNLSGVKEVNQKIRDLSESIPEHSKIFFHVLLATSNAEISNSVGETSSMRSLFLDDREIVERVLLTYMGELDVESVKKAFNF